MTPDELKAFQEALIKELGLVMDEKAKEAIEAKFAELQENLENKSLKEIKDEIKALKLQIKESSATPNTEYKNIIAEVFREAKKA
jgi:hypothetical protein